MKTYSRGVKLPLKYNNTYKKDLLKMISEEYSAYVKSLVEYYYNVLLKQDFEYYTNLALGSFFPTEIDVSHLDNTKISGRLRQAGKTFAWRIIKSKDMVANRKRLYTIEQKLRKGESIAHLKINYDLSTPVLQDHIPIMLYNTNVKHSDKTTKDFDFILELTSLFSKEYKHLVHKNKVVLLFKKHKQFNKFKDYKLLNTVSLLNGNLTVFFQKEFKKKALKKKIGVDQGINKIYSAKDSDGNTYSEKVLNGYKNVLVKLSRKVKGSKSRKRTEQERTNIINHAYNLFMKDLIEISDLHLEHIDDMGRGYKKSPLLKVFNFRELESTLKAKCEENNIEFHLEKSYFKSQRCSSCGYVHKKNRNKEEFLCLNCNYTDDADLNSASNQIQELYEFTFEDKIFLKGKNAKSGFFWYPEYYEII